MNKIIIFSLMLLLTGVTQAQEKGHYLKFDLGGGQHKINYSLENGDITPGLGFTANAAYNYFFTPNWGFGSGLGLQTYKSTATLNYMSSTPSVDTDGDNFDYRAYYTDWQETQKMVMLDIPIAINYQHQFGENFGMLVTGGTKFSLPIKSIYEAGGGELTTTGYYPEWNVELREMPQHGYDSYTEFPSSDIESKISISAFADLGVLYAVSEKMDLYLGAYVNYGLSDVSNVSNQDVYQADAGSYNGVLASNQISEANLISFGVKIGINLHLSSKNDAPPVEEFEEIIFEEPIDTDTIVEEVIVEPIEIDTVIVEPIDTVPAPVIEEVIDWRPIASEKASQIVIYFDKDSDIPSNNMDSTISELSEILKNDPEINLLLVGYTCDLGSKEVNQRIGLQRANSMKQLLVENGIPAEIITIETQYYLNPVAPNTRETRAKNRRAEVELAE